MSLEAADSNSFTKLSMTSSPAGTYSFSLSKCSSCYLLLFCGLASPYVLKPRMLPMAFDGVGKALMGARRSLLLCRNWA